MATSSTLGTLIALLGLGLAASIMDNEENKRLWPSKERKIQSILDKAFEGDDGVTEKEIYIFLAGKKNRAEIKPRRDDCLSKQDVNRHERAKSTSFTGHDPIKSANTGSVSGGRARRFW